MTAGQEAKVCTCPSGDGSLRWPCPQHPPGSVSRAWQEAVAKALEVVNDAANRARHAGDYANANALVSARVTLFKASQPTPTADAGALPVVDDAMVERALRVFYDEFKFPVDREFNPASKAAMRAALTTALAAQQQEAGNDR